MTEPGPFWYTSRMPTRSLSALVLCLAYCGPEAIGVSRMMMAPPRPPTCELQVVQASMMELSPMGKYDILGYVNVAQLSVPDPLAEANRAQVRPKACELGGTYIAIMTSATNLNPWGIGKAGATVYAVLRDKSTAPVAPQKF